MGFSRSTMYKEIQEGKFPPPIKLGKRSSAWIEAEVEENAQARIRDSRKRKNIMLDKIKGTDQ